MLGEGTYLLDSDAIGRVRSLTAPTEPGPVPPPLRVRADGKFFRLGTEQWFVKGFTYGPFAPNSEGHLLPSRCQIAQDFAHIRELGGNAVRIYHVPPGYLMDEAAAHGLRVFIDVPWDKHRCFFEDWAARQEALRRVRNAARQIGSHPAAFAISVANEIPKDIVRFYGARRVERFIGELVDTAQQESTDCLITYTNYPSTEFLSVSGADFLCFNVYLDHPQQLGEYLDRLQHVAGAKPLILGELGVDSLSHGQAGQAKSLSEQYRCVLSRGLAGSFVFSYTDDWFTGGHRVESWGFGVTDRNRIEKPAAAALRDAWARPLLDDGPALPRVSVVVCSYNGAATLEPCLRSLKSQDYPDYEVILVDDGSRDQTPRIAAGFPEVRYVRQENRGLSAARNAGAEAATGQIVAYTDVDCVAAESWLRYLVQAMRDQGVQAIGGPNVPPPGDGWVAHCVAASPGGPSHVMLDDRFAEHVPGCNMAFDRKKLLELRGFDPQFRVAGDDVDICWRFLDAGLKIGYAPSALVWHHRRATAPAYLKQQKGYGRAEGMLFFKHPRRFNLSGVARWSGIIYGEGAIGLPLRQPPTYYGKFGSGLFQIVYRHNQYTAWAYCTLLEWHIACLLLLALAVAWHPLIVVAGAMALLSLCATAHGSLRAPLPGGAPAWCRPLVFCLHLLQPVIRGWHRYAYRLGRRKVPSPPSQSCPMAAHLKWLSPIARDLYWRSSSNGHGREQFLHALAELAPRHGWNGVFGLEWARWDASLMADWWHDVRVHTATEELGGTKRFTRVRCVLHATHQTWAAAGLIVVGLAAALLGGRLWAIAAASAGLAVFLVALAGSIHRCLRGAAELVWHAGLAAELDPVPIRAPSTESSPDSALEEPQSASAFVV